MVVGLGLTTDGVAHALGRIAASRSARRAFSVHELDAGWGPPRLISRAGPCDHWISKISRFFRCRISDDLKVALRSVIRERLIYLDKTELDARVRVSRSQVFVELFTRTKTRIFLEKDRDARVDRVVVPTPAISLSA